MTENERAVRETAASGIINELVEWIDCYFQRDWHAKRIIGVLYSLREVITGIEYDGWGELFPSDEVYNNYSLKELCEVLEDIDPVQHDFVQQVYTKTNGYTNISESSQKVLCDKLKAIIKKYNRTGATNCTKSRGLDGKPLYCFCDDCKHRSECKKHTTSWYSEKNCKCYKNSFEV